MKADFIRAKYQFLAFVNKHKDAEVTLEDINKVCQITAFSYDMNMIIKILKSISCCYKILFEIVKLYTDKLYVMFV